LTRARRRPYPARTSNTGTINGKVHELFADALMKGGEVLEHKSFTTYVGKYADEAVEQFSKNIQIMQQNGLLARYQYVIRGSFSKEFRDRLLKAARETLGSRAARLFTENNIVFQGKAVPF